MAAGATHVFAGFQKTNLASLWAAADVIKMGIVTNVTVPSINDTDPRWGAGGSTNFATNEVTPGGNYAAGGITLTSPTASQASAVVSLNCTSPISLAAHASNPTGAYWGIFYDSTDANKRAIGFIDLGGPLSLVAGLQINVNSVSSGTQPVFQATAT